jgi:hypothetical protein
MILEGKQFKYLLQALCFQVRDKIAAADLKIIINTADIAQQLTC